jgi:hypothetical protein
MKLKLYTVLMALAALQSTAQAELRRLECVAPPGLTLSIKYEQGSSQKGSFILKDGVGQSGTTLPPVTSISGVNTSFELYLADRKLGSLKIQGYDQQVPQAPFSATLNDRTLSCQYHVVVSCNNGRQLCEDSCSSGKCEGSANPQPVCGPGQMMCGDRCARISWSCFGTAMSFATPLPTPKPQPTRGIGGCPRGKMPCGDGCVPAWAGCFPDRSPTPAPSPAPVVCHMPTPLNCNGVCRTPFYPCD